MTLSFLFKCHPFVINCDLQDKKIEFQYSDYDKFNIKTSSFDYLCSLNYDSWNFEVCSSNNMDCLFSFYLINRNQLIDKNLKDENDLNILNTDLYKILFGNNFENSLPPVLIIGSNDGCVYWKSFDKNANTDLNKNILLDVSSPIIYINSFRYSNNLRKRIDAVFNNTTSKVKQNNEDNCLFVLSKSGRLHLFAFDNEYFCKVLILPHYIKKCIKFKTKTESKNIYYLVYLTLNNQIYSINLDCCFKDAVLDSKLVKSECDIREFLIDEKGDLFVQLTSGRKTRLTLQDSNSCLPHENRFDTNTDKNMVKNCIDKLCILSNKIVQTQLKLDKINLALKQLNILQTIRINKGCNNEKSFFEVDKKLKYSQLEIEIINRNAQLDDNFNGSHLILTSVQMKKALFNTNSFYWINKCENFNAIKPNTKHLVNFDTACLIKNNIFPLQLSIFLIFDIRNYLDFTSNSANELYSSLNENRLFESEKRQENIISEFSVCIHQSEFELGDFFNISESEVLINRKQHELNDSSLKYSILMICNRKLNLIKNLENLWTKLCFRGINFKEKIDESGKILKKSSHLFTNILLFLEREQNNDVKNLIPFYKLDFLSHNNHNIEVFYQNVLTMIFFKNRYLRMEQTKTQLCNEKISKLKKLNSKLNYLKEKQRCVNVSLVENSVEMDGIEEITHLSNSSSVPHLTEFYSIETFLILFEAYLELRSIFYSC